MKILIVCSGNVDNFDFKIHQAFIYEQIEAVKNLYNIEYETFFIKGKGILGYLKNLTLLNSKIKSFLPDLIHAHFGLSGLLACLQRKKPVVITFHGSDGHVPQVRFLSKIAARISQFNIFVSRTINKLIFENRRDSIIPCGINLEAFYPIEMKTAREKLNMDIEKEYILFASNFSNKIKNAQLAFSALEKLGNGCELIELKDKGREEVNLLLNACNFLLLTSLSEGSPQIIKEAMACNCPIVSTDVGDVREVINDTEGCYITLFDSNDVAAKLNLALQFNIRTNGREKIKHFDNKFIAAKVYSVYKQIVKE
jgi:glycosyltransferase involved in cell wall biosynthesis